MKLRVIIFLTSLVMLSFMGHAYAADLLVDSFESADMSKTSPSGFKWGSNNGTSVVMQDMDDGPLVVYNNNVIYNIHSPTMPDGTVRDWTAKTGNHSLRFRYTAGKNWTEQRFDIGTPQREVWIRYWLRVPTNFTYGAERIGNNKFFSIWMDGYEAFGDGSTAWLALWPDSNANANLAYTYSKGKKTGSGGYKQHTPFFTTADRGRWMQIVWRLKVQSSEGASDGIIQTYRRWSNESAFIKLHEDLNVPLRVPDAGPDGFKHGYILGWASSTYAEDTEWLLDDFAISTSAPEGMSVGKQPSPPSQLRAN